MFEYVYAIEVDAEVVVFNRKRILVPESIVVKIQTRTHAKKVLYCDFTALGTFPLRYRSRLMQ